MGISVNDAIADVSSRRCSQSANDSAACRRSFLSEDSELAEYHGSYDGALEGAVSATSHRRPDGGTTSRPEAFGEDSEASDLGADRDPEFEIKAADVIGLYSTPPQQAAVFWVDEKTAIQALDRLDPVLPLSPGRPERRGFECRRNGTLSLYVALEVKTGKVQGKTTERHTSKEFVAETNPPT